MSKVVNNEMQANSLADNKIQAKKPEVGDIWVTESGKKYYIYNVFEDKIVKGFSVDTGRMNSFTISIINFNYSCKYLGKSKVNISDLFKTENE